MENGRSARSDRGSYRWLFAGVALLLGVGMTTPGLASSEGEIRPRIKAILEAFLRRPVTEAELTQVYAEEVTNPSEVDADRLEELDAAAKILREEDGKPASFHLRHEAIQEATFNKKQPFTAKLFSSVEPIAILDAKNNELMTENDLKAFGKILRFSNGGADPAAIEKAIGSGDAKILGMVAAEVRAALAKDGRLPEMLREASGFWAGLVQNWASRSQQDKDAARTYIAENLEGRLAELPDALYVRLMGWSKTEAALASVNKTILVGIMYTELSARMSSLRRLYLDSSPYQPQP